MDNIALVTGAAGFLGGEVARTLHARGYGLALVDAERSRERLDQLAGSLGGACVIAGDIGSPALWAEAMPRLERELGERRTSRRSSRADGAAEPRCTRSRATRSGGP